MDKKKDGLELTVEEWLKDNFLGQDIWRYKYCYKGETLEEWFDRVSGGDNEVKKLIKQKKFLFGGRTLSNRGTDKKGSLSNCYSRGYIKDDFNDILEANTQIAKTYKAQGGQGLSLSKIRPKGTLINGVYESDGIIPFMEMYNTTTSTVTQGGSRKGALMISLDIWHKEAENFITIKSDLNKINKANLSLEVDNEFMDIVIKSYDTGEDIIVQRKFTCGNGEVIEYEVCPIKVFKLLCKTSHSCAEPACLYVDRFRNYNLMEFVDEYQIETCNPYINAA